jgi:hypothetical protein
MPNKELNFNSEDFYLIGEESTATFGGSNQYIRLTVKDAADNVVILGDNSQAVFYATPNSESITLQTPGDIETNDTITISDSNSHFTIYQDTNEASLNYYIKPNEILSSSLVPEGNYTIQTDYLEQYKPPNSDQFIIKQISPSRKEVRLKLVNDISISENSFLLTSFKTALGDNTDDPNGYNFKHVLYVGDGLNIPIVNYTFDKNTNGKDNQSIILKLYEPIPTNISTLTLVTIEKEVLITQTEEVFYFSDIPPVFAGGSLNPDTSFDYGSYDSDEEFQNFDNLTSSLSTQNLNNIFTGSSYDYPNLNVNYNEFTNHTFFGSAKQKLENFKIKVETIQNYYGDISASLYSNGIALGGDSDALIQKRENLFTKINKEIKSFTPYEKFLYFNNQHESTASAPGVGRNYAASSPVSALDAHRTNEELNNYDGFDVVYKNSNQNLDGSLPNTEIDLFGDRYHVHNAPFFNYSGSIYLSFLLKGTVSASTRPGIDSITVRNTNKSPYKNGYGNGALLPARTFYSENTLTPIVDSASYQRYIFKVSHSYWTPTLGVMSDAASIRDWGPASTEYEILSGSIKSGSYKIKDSSGIYSDIATVITQSGVEFKGSFMPAGELFRITINSGSAVTQSFITDVKVSFNNPADVLPFDNLYRTSSTEWTNWYNGAYDSASAYDLDNIHNLENNLPLYIQQSSDYGDFKKFIYLLGEHFDLIKNNIDSVGTLNNRDYKKTDSVPGNLLPILLDNMGWNAINPFTGSLSQYFGNFITSETSIKDISENTWRKSLNNLIYLYKSKGTKNSIRTLLNIYGYPPDVLRIQEFGNSNEALSVGPTSLIRTDTPAIGITSEDTNLVTHTQNTSFVNKFNNFPYYMFSDDPQRTLNLDWWINDVNPNTIEFVYKHKSTTTNQEILLSSGSGALPSTASIQILSATPSHHDGATFIISSSDGTGKTYIVDDDSDGATGTLDGSGRVRVQINGLSTQDDIAGELSNSISHANGHAGKIHVSSSTQFFTSAGSSFITSDGDTFFVNSSGSLILTQLTASVDGNKEITTTALSASVSGFSGGSDVQHLWDLKLIPSSDGISSSFEFRLNNTSNASSSLNTSAVTMSTDYLTVSDGELWNVMLQRMTSSISGSGENEYRLHSTLQNESRISTYGYVTMSVSGGLTPDSNYLANQNWQSSGSRHNLSSSNLFVGRVNGISSSLSGSLAEIRVWDTALSTSKFRLHTLNKLSTIGNTRDSHKDELIYHFKLNENYSTGSTPITIIDANPNHTKDYSFTQPDSIVTSSILYGNSRIYVTTIGIQDSIQNIANDNKIIINPNVGFIDNLNPFKSGVRSLSFGATGTEHRAKRINSKKLEIASSPQNYIDDFILNKIQGFNLEKLYGNPDDRHNSNYSELDKFRREFFINYNISIDINKYIRSQESIYNPSFINRIKSIIPASSTLSGKNGSVGVVVKSTLLEKQKYKHQKGSVEVNPNTTLDTIEITKNTGYKSGFTVVNTYEPTKNASFNVNDSISKTGNYDTTKNASFNVNDSIIKNANYESSSNVTLNINDSIIKNANYESSSNVTLNINDSITKSSNYLSSSNATLNINDSITKSSNYLSSSNATFSPLPNTSGSTVYPISGSNTFIRDNNTKTFINIHNSWGTSSSDTHFINNHATGAYGDNNTRHIEPRYIFYSIGDVEVYSGSTGNTSDFTNQSRFYNRQQLVEFGNSKIQYNSYISGSPGPQVGRAMGKTRYFYTGSGNEIILPSNHVRNFSNPFVDTMYNGTQNINPGFQQPANAEYEDYSSASFYRVKVTGGELQIIVKEGKTSIDNNDNLRY